jgi:hypothetical protein
MISKRATILTFMIGGPLLWLPMLLVWMLIAGYATHGQIGKALSVAPAMGGFLWCLEAIFPSGWLYTWIPTLGTALLYRNLVCRIRRRLSWSGTRMGSMALHFAIAAVVSALVFSTCAATGALLGLHIPFHNTSQTGNNSLGVPDPFLTEQTIIGLVAMIGGILGATLGALLPAGEAPVADATRPVGSTPARSSPSLRLVLSTFLLVGPVLYMPLIEVLSPSMPSAVERSFGHALNLVLVAPVGAIVWYGSLLFPPTWLQTWVPTTGTAVLFWTALARLPIRRWASSFQGEPAVALAYAMTCCVLSVIVFALCQLLHGRFAHGETAQPSRGELTDLLLSASGHTVLATVAIVGIAVGGAVYAVERRKSRQ